jgi:hypothetical protein
MGMAYLSVRNVEDDDIAAFEAEAIRRAAIERRPVSVSELIRNELAKSAARFRRNAKS